MTQKQMAWKVKGMNQDLSVSAFNPEFAFENHNLRLSTNENNTTLSWVNEKGTAKIPLMIRVTPWDIHSVTIDTLKGTPIGTAVVNNKLVVFTTGAEEDPSTNPHLADNIYVLEYNAGQVSLEGIRIYSGNLNLDVQHPLETLVSYESSDIEKVYWTDGVNQPRLINIAVDNDKIKAWNHDGSFIGTVDTFFDFIPSVLLYDNVKIEKLSGGGTFAPGTIQYCFTYINKYQQQSNVVYQSPLYYLTHDGRGASPEDKVTNSFNITIVEYDRNFDYIRLYSIQRTSTNDVPFVKIVADIAIPSNQSEPIVYLDNGTTGSAIDPTELLYVGGKEIQALTMAAKDQTLFLGNIVEVNNDVTELQDKFLKSPVDIVFKRDNVRSTSQYADSPKSINIGMPSGTYTNSFELNKNQREITTFKGGETYRFGFQLQKHTGEWSEPIFLNDATNTLYPGTNIINSWVNLAYAEADIDLDSFGINRYIYKRIRPLVVFPNMNDRRVLCQGVLNPTVFNIFDRMKDQPFAQASWFFRPYYKENISGLSASSGSSNSSNLYSVGSRTVSTDVIYRNNNYTVEGGNTHILIGKLKYQLSTVLGPRNINGVIYNFPCLIYNGTAVRFNGYINLGDGYYAFFKLDGYDGEGPWPYNIADKYTISGYDDFVGGTVHICGALEYSDRHQFLGFEDFNFSLTNYEMYYKSKNSAPTVSYQFFYPIPTEEHTFIDAEEWMLYTIVFYNTASSSSDYEPAVSAVNTGTDVNYRHYSALNSAATFTNKAIVARADNFDSVEIQGSVNYYDNPFDTVASKSPENAKTNSQYFVDQSIVTLNSPDIEFDTAVQTWGTEDLKLRIVGAIPIQASISSHSITTKSELLNISSFMSGSNATFGIGEQDKNIVHRYCDYLAGKRLVADYLWNDIKISSFNASKEKLSDQITASGSTNYLVYPWQRNGSLNNDPRDSSAASAMLETKKLANFLFSGNTEYFGSAAIDKYDYSDINAFIHLTENNYVHNIRLEKQKAAFNAELNYYPNIDSIIYNENKYDIVASDSLAALDESLKTTSGPVALKYRSTSHAVIALAPSMGSEQVPILPSAYTGNNVYIGQWSAPGTQTLWGDDISFSQVSVDEILDSTNYHFLWLGELYRNPVNMFGGKTKEAIRANTWLVGGDSVMIGSEGSVTLRWTEGDTYYQRYDCLKTYPMSPMDTNQLVEILSFMCETRTNIDGRYDKNRGQKDNTEMTPQNFNLLNPAYTQQNNFFNYRQLDNEANRNLEYPNQIYFTKTKTSGADVDLWTNINLGSTLELEGDKGAISKLVKFNDTLLAFQERGISQILYNENVQIATQQGVPIEIANSGKVQGARYISDNVGCSNKWSVVNTASGVYFIDSSNKAIYLFNGQLNNITLTKGMNTWAKRNISTIDDVWYPGTENNAFVSYYDKQNNDVLFINKNKALAFSEKMDTFTSFYDYGDTPYFVNFKDTGIWIRNNGTLWKHQGGEYCKFFDEQKPYWMQLVGNAEPNLDKIFTNLEFRATVDGDGNTDDSNRFTPLLPFDRIEVWNEYQHGITSLENWNKSNYGMWHYISDNASALNRKFRIWRCDIPRDTAPTTSDVGMNISRKAPHPLNRIRNPWIYLKLYKDKDTSSRTEIHDMVMTYYL